MAVSAEEVRFSWVKWAEQAFAEHQEQYELYENAYLGELELAFSTDRWEAAFGEVFDEFADNWCEVVADAPAQRMRIVGWDSTDEGVGDQADSTWRDPVIRMPRESMDLIKGTIIKGDGYLICWPSPDDPSKPQVFFNDATEVEVLYDPANRRRIARAVKRWVDLDGTQHLRMYLPDHVESYVSINPQVAVNVASNALMLRGPEALTAMGWELEQPDIDNPYGEVPVFHFKNKPLGTHGISEIKSVIPIQQAINKTLMDLMLASEFSGFPQKWMAGAGHPVEGWRAGADRIWSTTDSSAKFGQFDSAELQQFVYVVQELCAHVAKITQTPMHYLRTSGDMPSGEALKTAESGLTHKCRQKAEEWKWTWADAMSFILRIQNGMYGDEELDALAFPVWDSFETRHDLEQAQTAQLKAILGVPLSQVLREHFGYSDEFAEENKLIYTTLLQQVLAQSGQLPPGLENVGALDVPQLLSLLPKGVTSQTAAGEATTKPQPNTRPPASPTRRSSGFRD
jgi:Phage portal protein, SPP1 Gp6-like